MNPPVEIKQNLYALNGAIEDYIRASAKTTTQVLVKQGTKLGFELRDEFAKMIPAKGSITSTQLTALKNAGGIRVRDSIKNSPAIAARLNTQSGVATRATFSGKKLVRRQGKKLNIQAFRVMQELSARESGRGYLAYAGRLRIAGIGENKLLESFGRFSQLIGSVGLGINQTSQTLTMTWGGVAHGGSPVQVGEALNKPRQLQAINRAIGVVVSDIATYHRFDGAQAKAITDRLETASRAPLK